jgi:putative RecB family exonuclease
MTAERAHNEIDHLSASQINLYLQCSLKYRFQYIDKLPKPFKPSGLAFGSVIHSALDWFHKQKIKGNALSLDKLLKVLEADWFSQKVETEIRYKNGETDKGMLRMGKQMLSQYFHSGHNSPVEAEVPFALPLVEPITGEVLEPTLEGIMDLIEQDHVVVEFKTSARTMHSQSLHDSLQLTCYSYAYGMLFQKEPTLLKVVNFVKTRTPKIVVLEAKRQKDDHQRFFHIAKEVLRGIQSQVFFPRQSFMCRDCQYEAPCKGWARNHN